MKKKLPTTKYTDDEIAAQLVDLATNQQQVMWILNNDTTVLTNKIQGLQAEMASMTKKEQDRYIIEDTIEKTYLKVIMKLANRQYYD